MKHLIKLTLAASIILAGCTIQKRHHMPGYSIQWNKTYKKSGENEVVGSNDIQPENSVTIRNSVESESPEKTGYTVIPEQKSQDVSAVTDRTYYNKQASSETKKSSGSTLSYLPKQEPSKEKKDLFIKTNHKDQKEEKDGTSLLLVSSLAIGLSSYSIFRLGKKKMKNYTRWAKYNPKKAQWLIAGLQLPLLALGLVGGYNLHEMGYTVSNNLMYGFAAVTSIGFATVPFLPNKDSFTLPKTLNRRRITFLSMTVAGLMMSTVVGNRLEKDHPTGTLTTIVKGIDQTLVSTANYHSDNSVFKSDNAASELQKLHKKQQLNKRLLLAGGGCVLGVFLIILLLAPLCAGVCLVIFGVGSVGSEGVLMIIGGIALTVLSIMGMVAAGKMCSKT